MSNEEILPEGSSGVQVRAAEGGGIYQEHASVGRAVPPARGSRHRKCLSVFLHGGPVGQAYCVIGSMNSMMSSRSDREQSMLLASDDHGVQEAENIIDRARKTSVVMTETVVQKAEEERSRRRDKARTGRSVDPVRRSASEALVKGWQAIPVDIHWLRRRPHKMEEREMTKVRYSWPQS